MGRGSTSYTQDLVAPLEQVLNDGTTNLVYGLARIKNGTGTWHQHDGVGSVRAVLDGAGVVQSTTSYDPWGTPQTALTDSFGFTGELHDGDLVSFEINLMMTTYPMVYGFVLPGGVCDSALFAARTRSAPERLATLKVITTAYAGACMAREAA